MKHPLHLLLALIPAMLGGTAWSAHADTEKPVTLQEVYKKADGKDLKIDIIAPSNWKPTDSRPAFIFFHGGGWVAGSPQVYREQAEHFASLGIVCFLPEYRLMGKSPKELPTHCIQDAKSAMRWVRVHAGELGIDPLRIASGGASAGGHLAAFVGMMDGMDDSTDDLSISARSQAMVLYNPTIDNGPGGFGYKRIGDRYREFSPLHNVRSDAPPAVLFLGTEDKIVPVKVATDFEKAMKDAGVRCDIYIYKGEKHSFYDKHPPNGQYDDVLEKTTEFFRSLNWIPEQPGTH